MTRPARPRQYTPPTDSQRAAAHAEVLRIRAALDAAAAVERPLRAAMFSALAAAGFGVADIEAALDCHCSCHPTVTTTLHDGGRSCPCQVPAADRPSVASLLAALSEGTQEQEAYFEAQEAALSARAAELGVTARVAGLGAPFVITGQVDGRGFYLRERHGDYDVVISSDEDPSADPWTADISVVTLSIADGTDEALDDEAGRFSVTLALEVAVSAVRTYLLQSGCAHATTLAGDRFCRVCGTELRSA